MSILDRGLVFQHWIDPEDWLNAVDVGRLKEQFETSGFLVGVLFINVRKPCTVMVSTEKRITNIFNAPSGHEIQCFTIHNTVYTLMACQVATAQYSHHPWCCRRFKEGCLIVLVKFVSTV